MNDINDKSQFQNMNNTPNKINEKKYLIQDLTNGSHSNVNHNFFNIVNKNSNKNQ